MWFSTENKMMHTIYDALVHSCALHRLKKEKNAILPKYKTGIEGMLNEHLENCVLPVDVEQATAIRLFYEKKLTRLILLEHTLSPFREDLRDFLVSKERGVFSEKMLPLIYSLPELYEYDISFEQISKNFSTEHTNRCQKKWTLEKLLKIVPVGKLRRKRRNIDAIEYWFVFNISGANNLCCITIDSKNPLLTLWDQKYDKGDAMEVETELHLKFRDGIPYHALEKFNLLG